MRDSNIETLRIVSMFMVLALHANFATFGIPYRASLIESPWSVEARVFIESLCCVAVNVYVLLSGWYGIHFKWKRLFEFVFQVFFFATIGAIVGIIRQKPIQEVLLSGVLLMKDDSYWFVKAYFLLYVLSPILETYVEVAKPHNYKKLLILFIAFECVYGFGRGVSWFAGGYSTIHFIGLYLLSRYFNLYYDKKKTIYVDLAFYIGLTLLTSFVFITLLFQGKSLNMLFNYDSPFVIFSAMALVLLFKKVKMRSRPFINAVAASSFAVYLFHTNPFLFDFYKSIAYDLGRVNWLLVPIFMTGIFIISILIDRLRLVVWHAIAKNL